MIAVRSISRLHAALALRLLPRASLRSLSTAPDASASAAASSSASASASSSSSAAAAAPPPAFTVSDAPALPITTLSRGRAAPESTGRRGFPSFPAGLPASVLRAGAALRSVKGHTKKLNPVARLVSGLGVPEAVAQLAFSASQRAAAVRKVIEKAVKRAELEHGLPRDRLVVEAAWTGKHMRFPRIRHHAKGRGGKSFKRTSMVSVSLREAAPEEARRLSRFGPAAGAARRELLDVRGY